MGFVGTTGTMSSNVPIVENYLNGWSVISGHIEGHPLNCSFGKSCLIFWLTKDV
jgi:hypothetical protein